MSGALCLTILSSLLCDCQTGGKMLATKILKKAALVGSLTSFVLCIALSIGGLSALSQEPDRFKVADLHGHDLFDDYPPTVCVLKALLGAEYERIKQDEYQGGYQASGFDWETPDDRGLAGGVVESHCNYENQDMRILWVHRRGSIVVGIKRGANKIDFFTNDPRCKSAPAPVLLAFAKQSSAGEPQITWHAPSGNALQFAASCDNAKVERELKLYLDAQAGASCQLSNLKNINTSQWPYFVKPAHGANRAYLLKQPSSRAPAKTAGLAYLIPGDLVQVATTGDLEVKPVAGCLCAFYQAAGGTKTMGWINQRELTIVPETAGEAFFKEFDTIAGAPQWFEETKEICNYPGASTDKKVFDTISLTRNGTSLNIGIGRKDADELNIDLHIKGSRFASDEEGGTRLYLFNNAMFLDMDDSRQNPRGIYYPVIESHSSTKSPAKSKRQ